MIILLLPLLVFGVAGLPVGHDPMINEGFFEGDMLIGHDPTEDRNAVPTDSRIWPNKVIPYIIDPSLKSITPMIEAAIAAIEESTCIRLPKKKSSDQNYLKMFYGKGCYAHWGFYNMGEHHLSLGARCDYTGTVLHEILHAIGFEHEHNRSDRDDYLDILWDNIEEEWFSAFKKLSPKENRLLTPFDFDSVMLYGQHSFAKFARQSMRAKDGRFMEEVYNKPALSEDDIKRMNILYKCP